MNWYYAILDENGALVVSVTSEAAAQPYLIAYPDWRCEYRRPGQ